MPVTGSDRLQIADGFFCQCVTGVAVDSYSPSHQRGVERGFRLGRAVRGKYSWRISSSPAFSITA